MNEGREKTNLELEGSKQTENPFEKIIEGEFSKEFKVMEIEERFKHLSGKFALVCGTKDDIDQMESAFEEQEIDILRWDGNKIEKLDKEGLSLPAFNWNGQYLFIPKNIKVEIIDEGDHFIVNCFVPHNK